MTDSHRATSSSEDQAYHSAIHEARAGLGELHSTSEHIPDEDQTKWTYFLLGCAILLPWNGDTSLCTAHLVCAHVYPVLANAIPFYLSRLAGSPFYATFTSYWSSVYTLTKLVCQFYCTFTSKQVRKFRQ